VLVLASAFQRSIPLVFCGGISEGLHLPEVRVHEPREEASMIPNGLDGVRRARVGRSDEPREETQLPVTVTEPRVALTKTLSASRAAHRGTVEGSDGRSALSLVVDLELLPRRRVQYF
jgi:hypothetical protein